ncbi:MAG: TetR/AcrR family transcriptional regulator [Clostridiales bacterium]|nr:TetR/AcrR family transcriptional regulator [Clostridiales bacterium]
MCYNIRMGSAKDIIKETFLKLLEQRPLSQITVKDIVEESGVNRNTFYYHYADLPSLIEDVVMEETEKIISGHHTFDSIESAILKALEFTLEHRRAVMHLYNSNNRDIFNQYFMKISEHVITEYFESLFSGIEISEGDKNLLIHYHTCLAFGQAVDWIRKGMTTDIIGQFERLCELYKGIPEEVIRRASGNL